MSSSRELAQRAVEERASFRASVKEHTNIFRLIDGAGDKLPGLIVDCFGPLAIFQVRDGECFLRKTELLDIAEFIVEKGIVESVYLKRFCSDRSHLVANKEYFDEKPFFGNSCSEIVIAKENGIFFEIHPYDGFSVGLFLDQRQARRDISAVSNGHTVLNLFAYTCGFSVAAAAAGAKTTSIDISGQTLEWGKRNFKLNKLEVENHLFIKASVFSELPKLIKKKKQYHFVVLDPPSFSRGEKSKIFSLKSDIREIIELSWELVAPGGQLYFSTHLKSGLSTKVHQLIRQLAKEDLVDVKKAKLQSDLRETSIDAIYFKKRAVKA